jgi:Spy/CpxP family protein refolding chaperone
VAFTFLSHIDTAQAVKKVDLKAGKKDFIYENKPFEDKFFFMAKHLILRQDELKLTPEQVKKIKVLIAETRIKTRERDEDIDTVSVGLNTYLWENPLETNTINMLAMERLNLQVEKQRFIIKSFKKLSQILTKEQKDSLKASVK